VLLSLPLEGSRIDIEPEFLFLAVFRLITLALSIPSSPWIQAKPSSPDRGKGFFIFQRLGRPTTNIGVAESLTKGLIPVCFSGSDCMR
jgi:hypothetical protein